MLSGGGLPMLAATVCPLPLDCPDWCVNDKSSELYCNCMDDASTLTYTLLYYITSEVLLNTEKAPPINPDLSGALQLAKFL